MTLDTVKTHVTHVLGKLRPKAPANPRSKRPCLCLDPALVRIHDLPGGHLTTSEHPDLLARAHPRAPAAPKGRAVMKGQEWLPSGPPVNGKESAGLCRRRNPQHRA